MVRWGQARDTGRAWGGPASVTDAAQSRSQSQSQSQSQTQSSTKQEEKQGKAEKPAASEQGHEHRRTPNYPRGDYWCPVHPLPALLKAAIGDKRRDAFGRAMQQCPDVRCDTCFKGFITSNSKEHQSQSVTSAEKVERSAKKEQEQTTSHVDTESKPES